MLHECVAPYYLSYKYIKNVIWHSKSQNKKMCKNIKTIYGENLWENSKFCLKSDVYFKHTPRR